MRKLKPHETITTVYPKRSSGEPGTGDNLIAIIRDGDGQLREEYIDPEKWTPAIDDMYAVACFAQKVLNREAHALLGKRKRG